MNDLDTESRDRGRLDHRIPPPVVVLLTGVAMWAASRLTSPIPLDDRVRCPVAGALALLGLLSAGLGVWEFAWAETTIDPVNVASASTVVRDGIFRYTRNPMYLGMTTVLLGWGVLLAAPWALLGPALFALIVTRFQIVPEERALGAKFGRDYADYRMRVRRWL